MQQLPYSVEMIDLFCGAGGVTEGVEQAEYEGSKIATVVAAVNHDPMAIESHWKNHPHVKHFEEDIRKLDISKMQKIGGPGKRSILWGSLECTNFSNAKGGQSREQDSRTLAWDFCRYVEYLNTDYVYIENVREFLDWGPVIPKVDAKGNIVLDKKGKPVYVPDKTRLKEDYNAWIKKMESYGYRHEHRILNSADYGYHTARERLFIIFAKEGLPIAFPEPTHSKTGENGLLKWNAVKGKIDLTNEGISIFEREKYGRNPLVQNTLNRIAYGVEKFVLNGESEFLMSYYGNGSAHSLKDPLGTITTKDRYALVKAEGVKHFLLEYYGRDDAVTDINRPAKTITTNNRMALVTVKKKQFITQNIWGSKYNQDIEGPIGAILTRDEKTLVTVQFLAHSYSGGGQLTEIEQPHPSITTVPKSNLVSVDCKKQFIEQRYGSKYNVSSLEDPLGTITVNPKSSLITILKEAGIITDIKTRMLTVQELKEIQGFHPDYVLEGNSSQQKKFIGNSVVPGVAKKLIEAMYEANLPNTQNYEWIREAV